METIAETASDAADAAGKVARELEPLAVVVFLGAGAVITVAELLGVTRKGRKGDTISDLVWWARDKLPTPLRYGFIASIAAFFTWATVHFGWGGD